MQGLTYPISLALAVAASTFLIQLLWWYYLEDHDKVRDWIANSELSLHAGSSYALLAFASMFAMFLEILVIRWISSEVRIFAYFKNLVLIACFLGFGVGCYLSRRRVNVLALVAPLLLLSILVTSRLTQLRLFIESLPAMLAAGAEVQIWGMPAVPVTLSSFSRLGYGLGTSCVLFVVIGFVFIPVGQLVGAALENAQNLITAYSVNVAASLAGILLYTVLCLNDLPPSIWFAVAGLLFAATLYLQGGRKSLLMIAVGGFGAIALLTIAPMSDVSHTYWSPYQKLTLTAAPTALNPTHYQLATNDSWYQQIVNLSPEFVASHQQDFSAEPVIDNPYNLPYRFYPNPSRVLILGSGMGNDVAAALRNGAGDVAAVEIDPFILDLGRKLHFEKPYSSPKVHVVVNDARNYIQNSREKFDLIVFSLLDSHTTSSNYSNIRIDNFVYTVEGMQAARRLLADDGLLIIKFQADRGWIVGRLENLLKTVFQSEPVRLSRESSTYSTGGSFFVIGSEARLKVAMSDPALLALIKANTIVSVPARPTTDDWPYFYQQAPGLPLNVILLSVVLLLVCSTFIRRVTSKTSSVQWHFFFLGAAFLLLEAQVVSKSAMLFGTTWLVNSIVIGSLLILIIAANITTQLFPNIPQKLTYAGIFVSLFISWSVPVRSLLFSSMSARVLIAALVLCAPAYFAGLVFIRSFSGAQSKSEALGSNLFGALAGGLVESLSFWIGLNALVLIAILLYAASALMASKSQATVHASSANA